MIVASRRIVLEPSPAAIVRPGELEACFVGHAPGEVRPERLAKGSGELAGVRDKLHGLGFHRVLAAIDRWASARELPSDTLTLRRVTQLCHLPLALSSPAELTRLFPEASTAACRRRSALAGNRAWLNTAVEDFSFMRAGAALGWSWCRRKRAAAPSRLDLAATWGARSRSCKAWSSRPCAQR